MHFLIWIPDGREAADLTHVGLSDLAPGAFGKFMDRDTPDGRRGVMIGWAVEGTLCPMKFMPDDQEWLPAVQFQGMPAGRYSVGVWKASPPTPGELRRPRFYGGRNIALADGNEWAVPKVADLPHAYVLDGGFLCLKPRRGFEQIVSQAETWEAIFRTPKAKVPAVDLFEYAVSVLSLNHRLTREVASYLELFTADGDDGIPGTLSTCLAHCIRGEVSDE